MQVAPDDTQLLLEAQAAQLLHVGIGTMRNWRATDQGPKFLRLGARAVRYRRTDIDEWLEMCAVGGPPRARHYGAGAIPRISRSRA
jgi:predicted DNA-binding transcriptional regulator AlpA